MNAAVKLSAYGAVLALVLGGGWALGTAVGPLSAAEPVPMVEHDGMAGVESAGRGDDIGAVVTRAPTAQSGGVATVGPAQPGRTRDGE